MGSPRKQNNGMPFPVGIPIKRILSRTRFASASGREKGLIPTPERKSIAKRSRSYKDVSAYRGWVEACRCSSNREYCLLR